MKNILKILLLFTLCFGIFTNFPDYSFALDYDYENGHFEKVKTNVPLLGQAIKLQNGNVLISYDKNILFNPKNNTFKMLSNFDVNLDYHDRDKGILLNNGNILFIAPLLESPSEKFSREIYQLISDNIAWRKYRNLSETDKEKIYLPYIKKEPALLNQYNRYLQIYENSMYAKLYNPATDTFTDTGKLNIRRSHTKKILLDDGNVLIMGGMVQRDSSVPVGIIDEKMYINASYIELYNTSTGLFTLLAKYNYPNIKYATLLQDNRIFIVTDDKFVIYDYKTNKFTELKNYEAGTNFLKLPDDRIIFISTSYTSFRNQTIIKCYNPKDDSLYVIGNLLVPRGEANLFKMTLLTNDKILITGGENTEKSGNFSGDAVYENKAEIFDIKTGKSKLLNNMTYKALGGDSVLLDDGRILFYFSPNNANLYIPKVYRK